VLIQVVQKQVLVSVHRVVYANCPLVSAVILTPSVRTVFCEVHVLLPAFRVVTVVRAYAMQSTMH